MPRKLSAGQQLLREQIALLSAHINETKREERAAAKVAKATETAAAAALRPPRWHLRLIGQFHKLRKQIADANTYLLATPRGFDACKARCTLDAATHDLAYLIRDRAGWLADELAGTCLTAWAAFYLQSDRRVPAPFPTQPGTPL